MKTPVQEIDVQYGGEVADLDTSVLTRALWPGF